MNRLYAAFAVGFGGACTPNPIAKQLHEELLRVRVLLEHPTTTQEELRQSIQTARLDFEANKASLNVDQQASIDGALSSDEVLAAFAEDMGSDAPKEHCADLTKAGAYASIKAVPQRDGRLR